MSGISFHDISPRDRYKPLCGVVVPRPVRLLWWTTLDESGAFALNRESHAQRSGRAGTGAGKPFKDT
jgi:hypothetical protein